MMEGRVEASIVPIMVKVVPIVVKAMPIMA
jgi:hypothetical protein